MTYYLYKHPSGQPEIVSPNPMPKGMIKDLTLMGVYSSAPDIRNRVFNEKNELVPVVPDYVIDRRPAYPSISDQLDALWKEFGPKMKHPEAKAMYEQVQKVKNEHPKITDAATGTPLHPLPHREAPEFPGEPVVVLLPIPEPQVVQPVRDSAINIHDTKLKEVQRAPSQRTIDSE